MNDGRTDPMDEQTKELMRALDGELDAAERAAFEARLADDPQLREEWRRLSRAREATMGMRLRRPPEAVWDGYWTSVYSRTERGLGWILFSLGAMAVLGWAVWTWVGELLTDTATPLIVRFGMIAMFMGLVILAVSVVRHRINVLRTDPYKDIQR